MKMNPEAMRATAIEASDLLKTLASPHRLMIVCQLVERPRSVGELIQLLGLRQATVSQHLALLRKSGLVSAQRVGQIVWYSISSAPAQHLLKALYEVYCGPDPICARPVGGKSVPSRAGNRARVTVEPSTN